MSALWAGAKADTVCPLELVRSHAPFSELMTPGHTSDVTRRGKNTWPKSFHTFTRDPSTSPRAAASAGFISSTGIESFADRPPNVEVMRLSEAGVIKVSGKLEVSGRYAGNAAP